MKKITLCVLALVLLAMSAMSVKSVKADQQSVFDAWNYTEIRTSGTVFLDGGRVAALYASTDTTPGANYFVLVDTPGVQASNAAWPASYPANLRKSPALFFVVQSTPLTGGISGALATNSNMSVVLDYGDYGIRISSAAYIFKTAASSGEALKVGVKWRK